MIKKIYNKLNKQAKKAESMIHLTVSGSFKIDVISSDNKVKQSLEFANLVTNAGLDWLYAGTYPGSITLGSGNTTPSEYDVSLASAITQKVVESINRDVSPMQFDAATSTYYRITTMAVRFDVGEATGILSEIGTVANYSNILFSRALIKDSSGVPTTITILADEVLDVTYSLRVNYPSPDVPVVTTLPDGRVLSAVPINIMNYNISNGDWSGNYAGNVLITAQNVELNETVTNWGSAYYLPYVTGSFQRILHISYGLDGLVLPSGSIDRMILRVGGGETQVEISPPILKTSNDVISFDVTVSWGRN